VIPGDQAERRKALESNRNLAVTAGAGTGKTTLLVEKILRKVLVDGVDLRRVLALTFTEKAANEMRQRLREKLEAAGKAGGLDRAEIGTIHSFCAHVLREFPIEAGVAPDFKVDEGPVFRRRFDEAWPRWLDRELGPDARRPRAWQEVLARVKLETLRELARGLASFAIPEERGDAEKTLRLFTAEAAREVPELAAALEGREAPPARKPRKAPPLYGIALRLAQDVAARDDKLAARALALVSDFAREFRRDFLAAGYVSFEGMLALTHDLFRNPDFAGVPALLKEKYEYILVDEFQDTDPVQGEIIQRLAEGPDGRLVPGKLFLVGDPKQSIYGFRGADIVAYQALVDRILAEGGEPVVLSTNFRSHAGILEPVNAVFRDVIRENGRLQPRYEPIEPAPGRAPALPGPHLEIVLVEDAGAQESRETEAEAIAEWIDAHRGLPFRDVAVLFRALTDVTLYIEALRSHGIPYVVEGEKFFYGTSEVIDFVNLLRAIANPHDRIAVAGVLRSPYGALKDQDLYARRDAPDYLAAADLPILRFLKRWYEMSGRVSVPELIDAIFRESYALEIAQAGYHGEQATANLLKLRRKAAELEAQGGSTLREFLDGARQAIRELEEEGESPLADETLDAVRILSIHKAKGLEFPVVILPDLHRLSVRADDRVVRFDWPTRTLGVRLDGACDAGGAALAFLDRERRREEWKRLLYVAVTRAREVLVMLGSAQYKPETYLALLMPELERRARVVRRPYRPPSLSPPPPAPEGEKPDWDAFVRRWRERERRSEAAGKFTSPTRLERGDDPEDPPPADRAIAVGLACHRALERLDFAAPRVPEGTDPEAARILEGFFRSAAFGELAEAEILARELPFTFRRGDRILQGVIDVVYRKGGKVYVGDYKTDKMMQPEDYGLIREAYTEAVRRIFGEEPGFQLFYLRHGEVKGS
jgi:ATP-dependent helicase/nuclease subunit A